MFALGRDFVNEKELGPLGADAIEVYNPRMACPLCGGTGGSHTLSCPKSPARGQPVEYRVCWHLTKAGWVHGDWENEHGYHKGTMDESEVLLAKWIGATEIDGKVVGEPWEGDEERRGGADEREICAAKSKHPFPGRYKF